MFHQFQAINDRTPQGLVFVGNKINDSARIKISKRPTMQIPVSQLSYGNRSSLKAKSPTRFISSNNVSHSPMKDPVDPTWDIYVRKKRLAPPVCNTSLRKTLGEGSIKKKSQQVKPIISPQVMQEVTAIS